MTSCRPFSFRPNHGRAFSPRTTPEHRRRAFIDNYHDSHDNG